MTACHLDNRRDRVAVGPAMCDRTLFRCVCALLYGALVLPAPDALAADPARATPVFRCGAAYSDMPCIDSRALRIDDSRSAVQRSEAAAVATREAALASQMMGDRQQDEASLTRSTKPPSGRKLSTVTSANPTAAPQTAAAVRRTRTSARRNADSDDFVAFVPRLPRPPKLPKLAQ